jgi:hypothetical protein
MHWRSACASRSSGASSPGRLLDVQRVDARTGRLRLDPGCESELRDLLAREKRCCSCFGFEVESTEERLAVTVRAPAGSEAALAGLLELA